MNFSIGTSGLRAAQQAIELIGTNLANAATKGYHRQDILLSPQEMGNQGTNVSLGGVRVDGSSRAYDVLIERENLRILPELGQIEQELSALTSLEAVMGDLENNPLNQSLNNFFSSLSSLTADPTQSAYARDVVWSADGLCSNLRLLGKFLVEIKEQFVEQARQWIEEINGHSQTIAELNREIELAIRRGVSPNILKDQRDEAAANLAELADVQVNGLISADGQANVYAWGTPLVMGSDYQQLSVGVNNDGELGVSAGEMETYSPNISGGKIGALAQLYNEIIPEMQDQLDALAQQIMWQFNNLHAQGVGQSGSFTELTGVPVNSSLDMGDWQPPVSDGALAMRLIGPDGTAVVHEIHVGSETTVSEVIDQINLLAPENLSANLADGALYLQTGNGYSFDFVPTYTDTASAAAETLTGRAVTSLRDAYFTGDDPADELVFDLGTTAAEEFTYVVGDGSKTLYEAVRDINAWSTGVHDGWQAAGAVWDEASEGFVLQLHSYDDDGSGAMAVTNTNGVTWSQAGDEVDTGDFVAGDGRASFSADVTISGMYTGENQTFTCRVVHPDGPAATGQVGIQEDLTLEVYNEASELVKVLSVGLDYPAGEPLEIVNGMQITLGMGTLTHGEEFSFTARSESDETMFLASAGVNTFFRGQDANDIRVRSEFYDTPELLAVCRGTDLSDNANVSMMLDIQSARLAGLGNATPDEHYTNMVTTLGQRVMFRQARQETLEAVHLELINQRDVISGVDTNEEAAKLLVYERMFQSMSKLIMTQNDMLDNLMNLL